MGPVVGVFVSSEPCRCTNVSTLQAVNVLKDSMDDPGQFSGLVTILEGLKMPWLLIGSPMLMVLLRLRLGPGQRKRLSTNTGTMARSAASALRLLLSSVPFRAYLAPQRNQLQCFAVLWTAQTPLQASTVAADFGVLPPDLVGRTMLKT